MLVSEEQASELDPDLLAAVALASELEPALSPVLEPVLDSESRLLLHVAEFSEKARLRSLSVRIR